MKQTKPKSTPIIFKTDDEIEVLKQILDFSLTCGSSLLPQDIFEYPGNERKLSIYKSLLQRFNL